MQNSSHVYMYVVSDFDAVVVADCEGKHCFTYTRHPLQSELSPRGICTDTLSHILVCNLKTEAIQIKDKDGQFLSNPLTDSQKKQKKQNHGAWVMMTISGSNHVITSCVYRSI